ncbi:hypothetical protein DPMN_096763 [Dreissena polymorpha]|uniref:MAM domain-containing protein n=1 Tax=Dreissena polymorpha TaxID=45954 RepID=A0A9D4LAH4_DREPO|nr:hypothetical protein DPMN_096763 [Dreissena polymorpha]
MQLEGQSEVFVTAPANQPLTLDSNLHLVETRIMWAQSQRYSWRQDSHDIFDWTLQSGTTSSGGTGPPGDHTTHASDPRVQGDNAAIVSHTLSANKPTCLSFFYNMFGDSIGDLDVTIVDKCSGQTQTVFHESGNKGEAWKEANVSIPASAVPNEYEIKIGATVGSSFEGDIALDDIFIQETSCAELSASYEPNLE